jgi:hypothetical protein
MTKQDLPLQEVKSKHDFVAFIRTNKDTGFHLLNLPGSMSRLIPFILLQDNFKL